MRAPTNPRLARFTRLVPVDLRSTPTPMTTARLLPLSSFLPLAAIPAVLEGPPEKDAGYQAATPPSGPRLNTSLKDTAAAISPFTKEFLDDIGATKLDRAIGSAS